MTTETTTQQTPFIKIGNLIIAKSEIAIIRLEVEKFSFKINGEMFETPSLIRIQLTQKGQHHPITIKAFRSDLDYISIEKEITEAEKQTGKTRNHLEEQIKTALQWNEDLVWARTTTFLDDIYQQLNQ